MKANEVVARLDAACPNTFPEPLKCDWINAADASARLACGTDPASDGELFITKPYDMAYDHYAAAMMAYINREYEQYQNARALYLSMLNEFICKNRRDNRPPPAGWRV